tara:strand:+ start:3563 stop:3742 length:180 start_codon:yes stop_codon:yes gene_type:complete
MLKFQVQLGSALLLGGVLGISACGEDTSKIPDKGMIKPKSEFDNTPIADPADKNNSDKK